MAHHHNVPGRRGIAENSAVAPQITRRLNTEFLLDLREVAETVWTEQNPVVNFAGAKHEADRGSLGCSFLVEDNHVGCE